MNSNTEVPVQMVMPELNAGQPMQNENANSSSQSNAVMHPTMTMAQSPLQQQMQAMQQNLNSNSAGSVQMVMSDLNTQVQMVQQNENIAHSGSSTQPTLMHQTGTMAQASMQHVQVIPQAMSTPYFQSMYSPQQQMIFPNLTLHTGTSPMVQSITQNPNVQLQAKQELLNKVSVTGPTYQIVNAVTTKGFPTQNLIAKPMYSSSVNVNSPTQVSNANQLKQITSQPQMITTQASSGAIYQPQIFGPFTQLPQNLTWATTPGTYQHPTLLSANVIIRNQQPEMLFQPSPQTMIMPVGTGTTQLPGTYTYALVQPQKPQQITQKHLSIPQTQLQKTIKVRNISPSVATQTSVNEKLKIAIPRTRVNQNIVRPKGKFTMPLQYNTALSSILPPQVTTGITTDAQNQVQLGFQLEPTTQLDVSNQILPNQIKSTASTETDTLVLQNQVVSSEISQPVQHLLSKPEVISTPTSVAQITNSAVGKPVAMVIASTVNTTLSVNSVVTSPTFVIPGLSPIVSSVETPISVPPGVSSVACPPTSCSVLSDANVLDSASSSVPLPETNNTNEESISATVSDTQDLTCESRITNCLKPIANIIDQLIEVSETETIDNSSEHINTDTSKPPTEVSPSEPKTPNVLKSQTCNSECQTPVSVKTHISGQKKTDKLVFEKLQQKIKGFTNNELTTNILKPEKQAKTSVTMSDVSVPEAHVRDCVQRKDENSKDKTEYNLDIVIKKEPVESSPAKVEKERNFKEVAENQVVLNQADSSVSIKNDHDRHQSNNIQTGPVQQPPLSPAPTVENISSQTDAKSKTVDSEINCNVTAEKKSIDNKTSDSIILENKIEESITDSKVSLNVSGEQLLISKQFDEKECDGHFLKNLEFIEQETFSVEKSDIVPQNVMSPSHIMGKQKQRLKAVVRPHILTHVIDGFVIYESSEPFPVNKSALMSDSCAPVVPKIADSSKKHKGSKHISAKNPDEPTKPDDLREPNEPAKTDFPKKRSDRIKLMETQKQLDLKKSEPKKPNDLKKVIEPKTPTEKKTMIDIKKEDEPKKLEDPKKIDEPNTVKDATPPNDVKKPNQAVSENIPKTPGRRGRKRKELRSRRGRKKLIPDNELNTSSIEIIVIDEDNNGPDSDAPEDESSPAPKTPLPVQTADVDEAHKSPIEDEKSKQPEKALEEKTKDIETDKKKRFNEKLPTEWSVEDVCDFVRNIPNCQDYAEEFRSQEIDGKALLLLKVDHIVTFTSMKFGPALKLISLIDDMKEKYSLEV